MSEKDFFKIRCDALGISSEEQERMKKDGFRLVHGFIAKPRKNVKPTHRLYLHDWICDNCGKDDDWLYAGEDNKVICSNCDHEM